jgi:predicted ATPase/class 3 adenylate cyclase
MAARAPAPIDPTSGTLTFLFTDIEGSTRLEQEIGTPAYGSILERHRTLLRAAFEAHGGREQGTEGDSFFVVFPNAPDALSAAIEAQRSLGSEAWPPGTDVRVRMGLNAGEASTAGGSLVGLAINRAARIAAAAHGGQIVVSEAVRSLVEAAPGVTLRPLGRHRLKDLGEPQALLQVEAEGLRAEFPPLRSIDARPNNLPTQLTSFVGRERELAEAGALLSANRLVTLTGPGGTGKTRLSLQVAAERAESYPDGIFFVALETVREPGLVASRLASAVGIVEVARRTIDQSLHEWLQGKSVLFVLDNFEQVLDAGPVVAELLRAAPGVTVLATSRAPLRVSGEQEYPVPGLPTPPDPSQLTALELARLPVAERTLDIAALTTYEAVRLFIARAGAVKPGFQVTNENAPAVAAICARLHGMPLAIELAAARVKLLAPDAILARLERQLTVLAAGSRDLPERQQTLRGAIAWSYDILDEGSRRLLDRLSVFSGGIDLEAATAICGSAAELGLEVDDGLLSLADQSLIRTLDQEGEPRFDILETIREFATERLADRGEAAELAARHSAWFLAFAERFAPELDGSDQRAILERFEVEHDNLRAVLDRAVLAADADTAIRLAFAIWRFWQKRGHLDEARRRLQAIAAEPWSTADPILRARLLEALGGVHWWQGDIAAMTPAYSGAVELWRQIGDRSELANALYNYSFIFSVPVDPSRRSETLDPDGKGARALEEALAIYRELGDAHGEANVLWGIGNSAFFANRPDSGAPEFQRALELFRGLGDRTMEGWSLHMLGGALLRTGHPTESLSSMRHALRHFHEASDAAGVTLVLGDLSSQALVQGDLPRAARIWGSAQNLIDATGAGLATLNEGWLENAHVPHIRNAMSEEDLDRYAKEGAAMSLEEAVAYALDVPTSEIGSHHEEPTPST